MNWATAKKIKKSEISNNIDIDHGRSTAAIIRFCSTFLIRDYRLEHWNNIWLGVATRGGDM